MKFGQKVKAFPMDESGPKVGFFLHAGGEGDDGKDAVQVGETVHPLAYHEGDDDPNGPNGTYRGC